MSKEPELSLYSKLSVTPLEEIVGPRLWVRRLVIWEDRDKSFVRDIQLRPGLNIVWSSDGSDNVSDAADTSIMGHGAGKTLFCRLIRYCLGEDYPADEEQRELIKSAFINGFVGAEIILDGVCWSVVRPLGTGLSDDIVVAGVALEEVDVKNEYVTGMGSFISAVEEAFNAEKMRPLIDVAPNASVWLVALAWLTRDQECRFHHVLDWRDSGSGSRSPHPANSDTKGPRLEALRAFIKALSYDEREARRIEKEIRSRIESLSRESGHFDWDIERKKKRLIRDLGFIDEEPSLMRSLGKPLEVRLSELAAERLAQALELPSVDLSDLENARDAYLDAERALMELEGQKSTLKAEKGRLNDELVRVRSEAGQASVHLDNADQPICKVCEVPIDRVLAEGCKLSHKLPELETCRERAQRLKDQVAEKENEISEIIKREGDVPRNIAIAKQSVAKHKAALARLEEPFDKRNNAQKQAEELQKLASELTRLVAERANIQKRIGSLEKKERGYRGTSEKLRRSQAGTVNRIMGKLEPIMRDLVSIDTVKTSVALSGQELKVTVNVDGNRRTAAIESLKVIAFDLACPCLSMESETNVPPFLIHDSPREADLGLPIYHRLFYLVRDLETATQTSKPLFQYIITTTTKPPDDLCLKPWLVLELAGSPGEKRLLGRDL